MRNKKEYLNGSANKNMEKKKKKNMQIWKRNETRKFEMMDQQIKKNYDLINTKK